MTRNVITDVVGVWQAKDRRIATGVTAVIFDAPVTALIAVGGGTPGLRDAALLEPVMPSWRERFRAAGRDTHEPVVG